MCNVSKALSRAATPPGTGGREAQAIMDQAHANDLAAAALKAKEEEKAAALAAADSASETTRQVSEARLRKLLAAGAFGATQPNLGTASIGYRQAFGG